MGATAIGYVRVSTDEQAKEGVSLEAQEAKIRAYASLNDLNLIEVVTDAGKSGTSLQREGLQRLIQVCNEGAAKQIIVYKLDRLSRSTKDLLFLIDDLTKKGIGFHSFSEKIDTETPTGRFFLTLMSALSQLERDNIAQRTKDVLAFKRESGKRLGHPVFGMRVKDGNLVPDESEAEKANYAATLRQQGFTLKQIADKMVEHGYKPKRSKHWSLSSLHDLVNRTIQISNRPQADQIIPK